MFLNIEFFLFKGKILEKFGYGCTITFSLVCYALRMGLISLASTPWWIVPIEFLFLGPTFALSYATTVAFANAISSSDISVSVQGITAGMREGLGKFSYLVLHKKISFYNKKYE